ncbi:hypothetical protein I4U23_029683 [Adineta vaga]|nr:hypothetical protein I4U23_029683 [Adineta vaga]
MSRTNLSNNNVKNLSSPTINEIYEKVRPLQTISNNDQAHGDDTYIEKTIELFSPTSQHILQLTKRTCNIELYIRNEIIFAMQVTDTSNEAIKTDDENGMMKLYPMSIFNRKEQDVILSDISLQQQQQLQQLPDNECEYEIDLGNGWITKSLSSYQSNDKKHKRTRSVLSADSSQPISTFRIPFTNTFYNQHLQSKQIHRINHVNPPNVLFNSHDYIQRQYSRISIRTISILSIGTIILALLFILIFLVF